MAVYKKYIHDHLHGLIRLTRTENRILETAYFQRLRWIKQLGFSFYIYPGATHTRFAHVLGVMHTMDQILKSIGISAADEKLYDSDYQDDTVLFHRSMRLAAMLHDIGSFPFSHTTELGYINHWRRQLSHGLQPKHDAHHENLSQQILTKTDFPGGITRILKEDGLNPDHIAKIIKGESKDFLSNQLMHSDIDSDRMDYLLRDALNTGIHYGTYDKNILLQNMVVKEYKGKKILCFQEQALTAIEYFLISRYSWYSNIIADGTSYKFDLVAAKITEYFLENQWIYSFDELHDRVLMNPTQWFSFSDSYFMSKVHAFLDDEKKEHPMISELCQYLAFRKVPRQLKLDPLIPTLIESEKHRKQQVQKVMEYAKKVETKLLELDPNAWMILDIPKKDVMFTLSLQNIKEKFPKTDPLLVLPSIKIVNSKGEIKLLADYSNSIVKILSAYRNFIPRIYMNDQSYQLLEDIDFLIKEY